MPDFLLDQRNATVLHDPANRERLARVDPLYIPSYVSWAAANQKLEQMALFSEQLAPIIRNNDTTKLVGMASIVAHDQDEFTELSAEISALTPEMRNFYANRAEQKAASIRAKVHILQDAWNRNIDLEVSKHGESRKEVAQVLMGEKGTILPAEMGLGRNGNNQNPNVVVVNNQPAQERAYRGSRIRGLGGK